MSKSRRKGIENLKKKKTFKKRSTSIASNMTMSSDEVIQIQTGFAVSLIPKPLISYQKLMEIEREKQR